MNRLVKIISVWVISLQSHASISWQKIGEDSKIQGISAIFGILGISVLMILTPIVKCIKNNIHYWMCRRIGVYSRKGYYSETFVLENIKKAKKIIRIICVRNARISSPDILRAFRTFASKNGKIELFYIDPSSKMSDDIIDKIRVTLPTPPVDVNTCRREIEANETRTKAEIKTWDSTKQGNISLYRFNSVPSIHLCQFDNKIFLGFQFFDPSESATLSSKTLNDLCTVINAKSLLGKLIVEQIDYLRDNQSEKQTIN